MLRKDLYRVIALQSASYLPQYHLLALSKHRPLWKDILEAQRLIYSVNTYDFLSKAFL